ncbi:unnamed protein product, partial [Mesorhabditis spiculigera]
MSGQRYVAEKWEIIRAQGRDEEEIRRLSSDIEKVILLFRRNLGNLAALPDHLATFLYYLQTVLADVQTVGDEYLHLIQSDSDLKYIPSPGSKLIFMISHVLIPLCWSYYQQFIRSASRPVSTFRTVLRGAGHAYSQLASTLDRTHLAIFYIFGAYYTLSRRWAGIRFLSTSPQTDTQILKLYRIFGFVTLAQCLSTFVYKTYHMIPEKPAIKVVDIKTPEVEDSKLQLLVDTYFVGIVCRKPVQWTLQNAQHVECPMNPVKLCLY